MTDMPERIWAVGNGKGGDWGSYNGLCHTSNGTEYVRADRIEELEAACWRMQEERDRAIGWRDSDKDRADKAEAKLLEQVMALPEIAVLVDALCKSADGWDNVIGMGLIAKKHFESARVLRDEAFEALHRVGVEL